MEASIRPDATAQLASKHVFQPDAFVVVVIVVGAVGAFVVVGFVVVVAKVNQGGISVVVGDLLGKTYSSVAAIFSKIQSLDYGKCIRKLLDTKIVH